MVKKKCGSCGCTDYVEHPFRKQLCGKCMHNHDSSTSTHTRRTAPAAVTGAVSKAISSANPKDSTERQSGGAAFKDGFKKATEGGIRKMTGVVSGMAGDAKQMYQQYVKGPKEKELEIGAPTNVKHEGHVGWGSEGLESFGFAIPDDWTSLLNNLDGKLKSMGEEGISKSEAKKLLRGTIRLPSKDSSNRYSVSVKKGTGSGLPTQKKLKESQRGGEKAVIRKLQAELADQRAARQRVEHEMRMMKSNLEMKIAELKREIHMATTEGEGSLAELSRTRMELVNERSAAKEIREQLVREREALNQKLLVGEGDTELKRVREELLKETKKTSHSAAEVASTKTELDQLKEKYRTLSKVCEKLNQQSSREKMTINHSQEENNRIIEELRNEIKILRQNQLADEEAAKDSSKELSAVAVPQISIDAPPPPAPPSAPAPPPQPSSSLGVRITAPKGKSLLDAIKSPDVLLKHVSRQLSPMDGIEGASENDMVAVLARALVDRRAKSRQSVHPSKLDEDDDW